DEVGAGGGPRVSRRRDAGQQRIGLLLRRAALGQRLVEQTLAVGLAAVGGGLVDVLEGDLDARLRADVGDRGAHHAGAEYDDLGGRERLGALRPGAVVDRL